MTPSEILFTVPGVPKPQGSKRGFVNKRTGQAIVVETGGQAHKDWRAVVALAATEAMAGNEPFDGPLWARITFKLPRPKSHGKKVTFPDHRPDLDKLARSVLDALTHVVFVDDGQIVTLRLKKRWAQPEMSDPVGVEIHVAKGWG